MDRVPPRMPAIVPRDLGAAASGTRITTIRRVARITVSATRHLAPRQLVFFERYGKLFLADEPLVYDQQVYRTLLALPDLDAA